MSKTINIQQLVRENIRDLKPYSSARNEYKGREAVFLDANENPNETGFNRYPDPLQWELKKRISELKETAPETIFLGNGSDEAIDVLFRIFCKPGVDNIISIEPSYGMYQVCADINDIAVKKVLLTPDFQLDTAALLRAADANSKLLFLCSPNNPTGNLLDEKSIIELIQNFNGLVVVDEAYIDFADSKGLIPYIKTYPNLVVLQTFSKAWGLAGVRLGMAFAHPEVITYMNNVKYPYNVNVLTQREVFQKLADTQMITTWVNDLVAERNKLNDALEQQPEVTRVYTSDANFILAKCNDARALYNYLVERKMIVRDRSKQPLCDGCLRMTIGTHKENDLLINYIKEFYNK